MTAKYPAKRPQLSVDQIELVAQFADLSYEYPRLSTFDAPVMRDVALGELPSTRAEAICARLAVFRRFMTPRSVI